MNNLYIDYEELKDTNEPMQFLKKIFQIKYYFESHQNTDNLQEIFKELFDDVNLIKYIQDLRFKNLKFYLKLDTIKKYFYAILALTQTNPEELKKLQQFIKFDQFLVLVIKDYPQRIICCNSDIEKFILAELKSVQFTEQDYQNKLSKQKGLIECLQFLLSIQEQKIFQEELDLELIYKELGELFTEESPSYIFMVTIMEGLSIDKLQQNVNEEKFNLQESRLQQEKFEKFLIELGKIKDSSKYSNLDQIEIGHLNQLAIQTNMVIETLQNFEILDKEFFLMLMSEELTILQSLLCQYKLQSENYQRAILQYRQEIKEKDEQFFNNKMNQNEDIQLISKVEKQKENNQIQEDDHAVVEKGNQKFKFCIKENGMAKLQLQKIKQEKEILCKLLEDFIIFSDKLNQIQRYQKEVQIKFQQKFQDRFQELTKNYQQSTTTKLDLQQKEDENFKLYFERISSNLSKETTDTDMANLKMNISDFLNSLKSYCQAKLSEQKYISNTIIEQEFMLQQIRKLYLQDNQLEENDEKSNQHLGVFDTLNLKFKDFNNNEEWKIRQGLAFTIIQISSNCFTDAIISFCQKTLIQFWVSEKDQRVRNLLKNENLINLQMQILKKDWQSQHDKIAGEMQQMLKKTDQLQEEISHEANLNKRDLQLKELDETTQQLDEYIGNISEMGQQLRLITDFVNHIRKGLLRVEGKIKETKEQLNSIGKSVEQLLEIRKWIVLKEAAYKNVKSIYVPLQTLEKGKNEQSNLMNLDQFDEEGGEVNEFLQQEKKVMLIHGIAGSGKSTAANKIEEYIWKLHEANKKIANQVLIPIYISLPSLKNPVFQAVEETLRQEDDYGFDDQQLKECKEKLERKNLDYYQLWTVTMR
ncbi:unnamed protein product [Paramecium sonneborni]|uniref:Uncharacterized protein n=1 Tax=Paramecium sonneborni TaxID=65129 RepID=A0A8S1N8Q3_9CILI|nr:unnamed protein product [Paramecium sonneborni]